MTIYAIVNDFPRDTPASGSQEPVWTLISPAAILQGGNPYFVPDFASRFEARIALAVRIGKLGKGIAPRFAPRYVDAVAPAVVFVAADRLERMRRASLPWTSALSYDRSLALGKFQPMEFYGIPSCACSAILESAASSMDVGHAPALRGPQLENILQAVSRDNTLKTGDIILLGIAGTGPEVRPGMRLRLRIGSEDSISFNIR